MTRSNLNCFNCRMKDKTVWASIRNEDLDFLNQSKIWNVYHPGQVIFYQGNACLGVYCIESGTIALRKNDGRGISALVRLIHAGDSLGYRTFFGGGHYAASAEALTESRICFIDKECVRKLIERNPLTAFRFLNCLARNLEAAEEARLNFMSLSVRARLAHLLLSLKDRFGSINEKSELVIELPMSRRDAADIVGTRPETIARTIRWMEENGVARFHGRKVRISDLDALMDVLEAVD